MSDFSTLAEFELRKLRNELRTVARSRTRIAMWIVSGLAFVFFVGTRIFAMHVTHAQMLDIDAHTAETFAGVYLIYLGVAFVFTLTPGAQFASVAEALLVGASQLQTRAVFVWLQLRAVWRTIARSFIIIVIIATTNNASGQETARMTALGLAFILVPPAFAFHIAVASPAVRLRVRLLGGALLGLGVAELFGVLPFLANVMLAQAHGTWWPTLAVLAIATCGIVMPPLADPVPELIAATRPGGFRAQRLILRRKGKRDPNGGATSDWIFDLQGVWVIFSGRLAAFLRERTPLYFALGLAGWFLVGLSAGGAAHFYARMADSIILATALPFVFIVCIVAASVGRDLGAEIRNPLWWAGDATMIARLGVDSFASLWRFLISMACVLGGYAAFGHTRTSLLLFVLVTGLVWLSRCCGYLLFAYFPATIDQRGALAGLRIFFLFVLAIPVGIVAGVVGFMQIAPVLQVSIVLAVALLQAFALLYVAARRIDGRIEAYFAA